MDDPAYNEGAMYHKKIFINAFPNVFHASVASMVA